MMPLPMFIISLIIIKPLIEAHSHPVSQGAVLRHYVTYVNQRIGRQFSREKDSCTSTLCYPTAKDSGKVYNEDEF